MSLEALETVLVETKPLKTFPVRQPPSSGSARRKTTNNEFYAHPGSATTASGQSATSASAVSGSSASSAGAGGGPTSKKIFQTKPGITFAMMMSDTEVGWCSTRRHVFL